MSIIQYINRPPTRPLPFTRAPDGALPVQESIWTEGRGWYQGRLYGSVASYLAATGSTFSRGSDATYAGGAGILRVAGSNILRIDSDFVTGQARGARFEGSASTLTTYTIHFADGTNPDPVLGIFSGYFGKRFTTSGGASQSASRNYSDPGGDCVATFIVEKTPTSNSTLAIGIYTAGWLTLMSFAWGTGALTTASGTAPVWSRVTELGVGPNGGRLVGLSFSITTPTGPVSRLLYLYPAGTGTHTPGAQLIVHYAGVVGGKLESSPIIAAASTAARLADALSHPIAGTATGTVRIEARTPSGAAGNQVLWQWDDGTADNRYRLARGADGHLRAVVTVGGTDVVDLDLGAVADSADLKAAFSWQHGGFATSLNGAARVTDTSYAGPLPIVTTMREGGSNMDAEWYGTIARMSRYSDAYLDIEELAA